MSGEPQAKTRAVIIGVSNYASVFPRLPAVESDVKEMKGILESDPSDFEASEINVLTGQKASRTQIIEILQRILSQAETHQSTFVYLAGHGTIGSDNEFYFVPFDANPRNIPETCVPLRQIKQFFDSSPSQCLLLWLDFCHSGGILARRVGGEPEPSAEATIERTLRVVQGLGKVIMCACTADQQAYEDKAHGHFTRYLIDGLKGGASNSQGEVTANSLHDYVDSKMGSIQQRPMFFGNQTGRIVLMKSRNILLDNEVQQGRVDKRLDFSDALLSPQAAYNRTVEIIGSRDKLAWRRLLNSAAQKTNDSLANWMKRSAPPEDNTELLEHALAGVNTAAGFIACLVAAAETEEENYVNDLGWIHTILTPSNWPTGGYTHFVAFPFVVLFIAQAVVGGALMEHDLGETAFKLATFKIRSNYRNNLLPIFEARDTNGWPVVLGSSAEIAWRFLDSAIEEWAWLKTGLAPNRTPRSGIIAYYLLLNFLGFARHAKNGIPEPIRENPITLISSSLCCLEWPTEEGNLGYSLLLKQAPLLNRILDKEQIDAAIFRREWPKWMKNVYAWFGSLRLTRQPAFASLPQDLD